MGGIILVLINLILAICLFFINGLLGKFIYGKGLLDYGVFSFAMGEDENFSGNFLMKTINPIVFMALLCAIFQGLHWDDACKSVCLIIPLFWIIHYVYISLRNFFDITNWRFELFSELISIGLGESVYFLIIVPLLEKNEPVFIPIEELRNAVWFAIIAYLAKIIWDISKALFNAQILYPDSTLKDVIETRYNAIEKRFGIIIRETIDTLHFKNTQDKNEFVCLAYAIVLLEDFNRSKACRAVERTMKRIHPKKTISLGIMQVKTRELINDEESIKRGIHKLYSAYMSEDEMDAIGAAIKDYNTGSSYYNEAITVFYVMKELLSYDECMDKTEENYTPYII